MTAELVLAALNMAITQCRPSGVIHHSDQGSQGEFNPSLHHFLIGGVDGYREARSRSSRTCKDAVTKAAAGVASIGAAAVLAGDRRRDPALRSGRGLESQPPLPTSRGVGFRRRTQPLSGRAPAPPSRRGAQNRRAMKMAVRTRRPALLEGHIPASGAPVPPVTPGGSEPECRKNCGEGSPPRPFRGRTQPLSGWAPAPPSRTFTPTQSWRGVCRRYRRRRG